MTEHYTHPDTPHSFEIRIKGRIDASNLTHAEFIIRSALSFSSRLWDSVEDFVIEVQPSPVDQLRRLLRNDKYNPED